MINNRFNTFVSSIPPDKMQRFYIFFNTKIKASSSLCDWLIIIFLMITVGVLEIAVTPHHQCIPGLTTDADGNYICGDIKDPELSYPYKQNTVSTTLLFILSFFPFALTVTINVLVLSCNDRMFRWNRALKKIEILSRMALFCGSGTVALTTVIKICVGRPRPNFYALHEEGRSESDHNESRMSFPSGHSSLSFAMLILLTLNLYRAMDYVQQRYKKQNAKGLQLSMNNVHSYFFLQIWWILRDYLLVSILFVFMPTFLAMFIACTRVTDYWHHYGDIAVGALLGIGGGFVSYIVFRCEMDDQYGFNARGRGKLSLIREDSDQIQTVSSAQTRANLEEPNTV